MLDQRQKCESTARTNCYRALLITIKERYPEYDGLYSVQWVSRASRGYFLVKYALDAFYPSKVPQSVGRYSVRLKGVPLGDLT
jgi:hypothetical protein